MDYECAIAQMRICISMYNIYKDTCITAQFVPVCLSVFGLLCTGGLNQLPGARALNCRGQQNVSSYWLYEWWSYLPVEWMAALTNDHLIFHFVDALILLGWLAWIKRYRGWGGGGGGGGGGGEQSEKLVIIENIHKSSAGMFRVSAKCLSQQIDVFSGGGYKSKKSPRLFPRPEVICFIYHEQSHEYFLFSCLFLGLNFLNWTKHRLDGCAGSVAAVGFVSRQMLHEEKKGLINFYSWAPTVWRDCWKTVCHLIVREDRRRSRFGKSVQGNWKRTSSGAIISYSGVDVFC